MDSDPRELAVPAPPDVCFNPDIGREPGRDPRQQRERTTRVARWLYRVRKGIRGARSGDGSENAARLAEASTDPGAMRRFVLDRIKQLGLSSPFTWEQYVAALQSAEAGARLLFEVSRLELGTGNFGYWFVTSAHQIDSSPQEHRAVVQRTFEHESYPSPRRHVGSQTYHGYLVLPTHVDAEHLERIAFHELGHLELGHIRAQELVSDEPALYSCSDLDGGLRERDAETFATVVMRLARAWDPATARAPSRDNFFDVLT